MAEIVIESFHSHAPTLASQSLASQELTLAQRAMQAAKKALSAVAAFFLSCFASNDSKKPKYVFHSIERTTGGAIIEIIEISKNNFYYSNIKK